MCAELELVWRCPFETGFDLIGIFPRRESRSIGNAEDVRVHRNRWLTEGFIEDNICCFPTNPRESNELFSRFGHGTVKLFKNHFAERDDILRFVPPKTDRLDMLLDAGEPEGEHFLWRVGNREQAFRGFVDADIRGLC